MGSNPDGAQLVFLYFSTIYICYCGKGEKLLLLLKSNFSSYPQYVYLLLSFCVRIGTRISLRDKRLFEITEIEIARVDCTYTRFNQNSNMSAKIKAVKDQHAVFLVTAKQHQ